MRISIIAIATVIHLLPHPFGVSPVGAVALYAGAHGRGRTAWIVPLVPLALGALLFGAYDPTVMAFVFGGYALATLAGRRFLQRERSDRRYLAAVATGAVIFYLVSNFSIWLVGYYPPTVAGLVECYLMGLPYLGQAMLADAACCFLLFGAHEVLERRHSATVPA